MGCEWLYVINAGLARVADKGVADDAAEIVAAQGLQSERSPRGRVVEAAGAAWFRHTRCQRIGRFYQARRHQAA